MTHHFWLFRTQQIAIKYLLHVRLSLILSRNHVQSQSLFESRLVTFARKTLPGGKERLLVFRNRIECLTHKVILPSFVWTCFQRFPDFEAFVDLYWSVDFFWHPVSLDYIQGIFTYRNLLFANFHRMICCLAKLTPKRFIILDERNTDFELII